MKTLHLLGVVLIATILFAGQANAQITTAEIYGRVTDASDAAIPNAAVKLIDEQTGAVKNTTTNQAGEFTFSLLPVSKYSLNIEVTGFKRLVRNGVELSAGQKARLNLTMEVGTVTEQVTVTMEAPLIETASPQQMENFGTEELEDLPLGKRDWTNVLKVQSGVDTTGSAGNAGGFH